MAEKIFLKSLYLLALIDTINGYLLHSGNTSFLGIFIKTFILFLCYVILIKTKYRGVVLFSIFYILIYLPIIALNSNSELFSTINHLSKFVTVVFVFFTIRILRSRGRIFLKDVTKIFVINTIIILANIYSGLFGVGYYAYDGSLGCKGFIYAHNEMSGMCCVLFGVLYFLIYRNLRCHKLKFITFNLVCLFAALLLSTKAGILLVLSSLIIVPLVHLKRGLIRSLFRVSKLWLLVGTIIIIGIIYYGYTLLDSVGAIDRWMFFFDKNGVDAIYSSRDLFWDEEKYEWINGNIITKLFGMGENRSVEMDHADTLLNYGIIGIVIVYGFYIYLLSKAYKISKKSRYARFVFYMDSLILAASFFAGHLIYSGLMAIYYAIMNAMIFDKKLARNSHLYKNENTFNFKYVPLDR